MVALDGEGVHEARLGAVAADRDKERGRGWVEDYVCSDYERAGRRRRGVGVFGLWDQAEAALGFETVSGDGEASHAIY